MQSVCSSPWGSYADPPCGRECLSHARVGASIMTISVFIENPGRGKRCEKATDTPPRTCGERCLNDSSGRIRHDIRSPIVHRRVDTITVQLLDPWAGILRDPEGERTSLVEYGYGSCLWPIGQRLSRHLSDEYEEGDGRGMIRYVWSYSGLQNDSRLRKKLIQVS